MDVHCTVGNSSNVRQLYTCSVQIYTKLIVNTDEIIMLHNVWSTAELSYHVLHVGLDTEWQ